MDQWKIQTDESGREKHKDEWTVTTTTYYHPLPESQKVKELEEKVQELENRFKLLDLDLLEKVLRMAERKGWASDTKKP